jgi:putative ABC transport system permease protein
VANPVLFNRAPGVSLDQARAAAVDVVTGYPGVTVQNAEEYSTSIANEVSGILNFIYVLLALAVIIALIGIANTLSLSITERTRELGLLRAVGMYRSQVRSTVRWEAVIVSVMGTVLGLALGLSVGVALVHSLADSGLRVLRIPTATIIAILGLAVVAGVLAAILPARRAARLDILAAIGTE